MRVWKMERYIKARLSGSKVSVSSTTFMYPSIYISLYLCTKKDGALSLL